MEALTVAVAQQFIRPLGAARSVRADAERHRRPLDLVQRCATTGNHHSDTEHAEKLASANQTVRILCGRTEPLGTRIHTLTRNEHRKRFAPRAT